MAGVNVLAENIIYTTQYTPEISGKTIFLGLVTLALLILSLSTLFDEDLSPIAFLLFIFIAAFGVATVESYRKANPEKVYDHTECLITIDDTVSFKEFNEKYEFIEQIGDLYKVKERAEDG